MNADRNRFGPYADNRALLYETIRDEGIFTWDMMYGQEYALAGIYRTSEETVSRIRTAADKLGAVFARTVEVIQRGETELLLSLGLPAASLEACRLSLDGMPLTAIGRFDFAVTEQGVKMLEFNSDTPTGIVEAFYVNGHVCRHHGAADPNEGMSAMIGQAFAQAVRAYRSQGYRTGAIVFSSLDWHEEDAGTTRYLLRNSGLHGSFAPLADLRVLGDRLYVQKDGKLEPVDLLYRLHALEKLAEEKDEDGYPTGKHMLDLIARRKLAVINPPSAFVAQTKALQALIWNLHETGQFYTPEEHDTVEAYMLPTYLDNRLLHQCDYVRKPIFGREGGAVTIFRSDGTELHRDEEPNYWEQPVVYQRYTELPAVRMETLAGMYEGSLLWGCFLIGGEASAVVARLGGKITGNLSYYVPVGIG
jgi:glutathionylspermidine synthase